MADDFYSLGDATDDYWRYKDNYNRNYRDDDHYYSTKHATSWLDSLLSNTAASKQGKLTPVQDINPDNVLATLWFNCFVCVALLGLYELLRRWIPSVYSQRLVDEHEGSSGGGGWSCGADGIETAVGTENSENGIARKGRTKAPGRSLRGLRRSGSVMNGKLSKEEEEEEEGEEEGEKQEGTMNEGAREGENKEGGDDDDENFLSEECIRRQEVCETTQQSSRNGRCSRKSSRTIPVLEWCIPVHKTPWSTLRRIAGLDAYFYLRYIRLCLKITAVSSVWALVILCPVYATGGGNQTGFYHFSMANVLQDDRGRVWVPTIFCWLFTLYCFYCVWAEMMHYVELRMEFLGGEEEQHVLQRKGIMGRGMGGRILKSERWGGYGSPQLDESFATEDGEIESFEQRSSRLSTALTPVRLARVIQNHTPITATQVQKQMKQHRYSLQIEKIPADLRSNTALFGYFNEMFPDQVHSACISMNVPDLDEMSARRMRVCRRLEKSLAYYGVTGIRPTHIAGRPRCRCCGIESTPIDLWCVAGCGFYDSCRMRAERAARDEVGEEVGPVAVRYETLPEKGECVDSIMYYTLELAMCNLHMKELQREKFAIAKTGISFRLSKASSVGVEDWYAQPLGMLKRGAAITAEGLREEFEVWGEDDFLGDGFPGVQYGSVPVPSTYTNDEGGGASLRTPEKGDVHPADSDGYPVCDDAAGSHPAPSVIEELCDEDFGGMAARRRKTRFHSCFHAHNWLRALLWRMGVDFLAAGLDEVRNHTDVYVDNLTRPSMSSTGFVTFKTLTPVTVATSAPLSYKQNPMEVHIAPETRDLVWQNVQIDQDIGASREFLANILLGLGVLLWSIPLTLVQAWSKLETVARIPGFDWVNEIPGSAWRPFVNGYLPVITLLGLILLLPLIFEWVATSFERRKTLSGVQNSIVGRYFYYQLANIYITVTAGALWTSLAEIIDHPQQLLVILGETLPKLAGYFISLLITKTLAGLPMVLLRAGALSRMMFLRSCFNKKRLTHRELKEVYRKQPIYYGWEYPTQFLVIIICFTYACITPFVLPVGAAYYFVALLVYKKQALYVYTPTYESGGRMFPQAVEKTLFALLISQLTFIGYTLIRKGVFQIILLVPLPFLTVFFGLFIKHQFVEPSKKLSLERAVKIDALIDQSPEFSDEAYQQPVLTEKDSVPVCETNDEIVLEVIENLECFQNEKSKTTLASPSSFDRTGCLPHGPRLGSCMGEHSSEILCTSDSLAACAV